MNQKLFANPLYVADLLEGTLIGTRLVTNSQGDNCVNGLRLVIYGALQLSRKWRTVIDSLLDVGYYQYEFTSGCYYDVIRPVSNFNVNLV